MLEDLYAKSNLDIKYLFCWKTNNLQAEDLQGAAWIWEAFGRYMDANILYMVYEPKVKESTYKTLLPCGQTELEDYLSFLDSSHCCSSPNLLEADLNIQLAGRKRQFTEPKK